MAKKDTASRLLSAIDKAMDKESYQELNWEGTFEDYLKMLSENPRISRNAFQRLYDMIISYGYEEFKENRRDLRRYHFFKDPMSNGRDAVFGLSVSLMHLVNAIKSAAHGYGTERRIILLHGPVGSSKSTIVRLMKKGLESYSRTRDGSMYTFSWRDDMDKEAWVQCPMHEDPLRLIPKEPRKSILKEMRRSGSSDCRSA